MSIRHQSRVDDPAEIDPPCPACRQGMPVRPLEIPDHEYEIPFRACYSQCDGCGSLYQTPMPTMAELASFYPRDYHSYTSAGLLTRIRLDMRIRRVAALLGKDDAFLDFGCGNGAFLYRAAKKLPGRRFFGYEIGGKREIVTSSDGAVTIVKGAIQDLWELLPQCRLIAINHAIEHLPSPEEAVRELFERLTDGGFIEGQTPAADSLERRVFKSRWSGYHAPRHTVVFSRDGLGSLLSRVGFSKVEITPAFNPAALAVSIGSAFHGPGPGVVMRKGYYWLFLLGLGTVFAPVDLWFGASGIIDFRASKVSG